MTIHIPEVARMYAKLALSKKKLDDVYREFRKLTMTSDMTDAQLKAMFYKNGLDANLKASIVELSFVLTEAQNLIDLINTSSNKRVRKLRHWQLMLEPQ